MQHLEESAQLRAFGVDQPSHVASQGWWLRREASLFCMSVLCANHDDDDDDQGAPASQPDSACQLTAFMTDCLLVLLADLPTLWTGCLHFMTNGLHLCADCPGVRDYARLPAPGSLT